MELLRAIADVLNIRTMFPRLSEIAKKMLQHDRLTMMFQDQKGDIVLEAASTDELSDLTRLVKSNTLVADDGETPVGSVFVIDAASRAVVDAFVRSYPYHVNGVWGAVQIHGYNRKRGTPIASRRGG